MRPAARLKAKRLTVLLTIIVGTLIGAPELYRSLDLVLDPARGPAIPADDQKSL